MEKFILETQNLEFIEQSADEAFASVSLNPTFKWCKFILTDDQPNANKHRIPLEEFDNLIKTGIHAPIKMAAHEIKDGHEDALPLGVITALTKENNVIKGLAALWSQERPEDVEYVAKAYKEGRPLNLSWEVLYASEDEDENGIKSLRDTALRATTLVGLPAYAGRTQILQVASKEGNSNLEETNLNELEQLQAELDQVKATLSEKEALLAQKDAELEQLRTEKESLAEFKRGIDEEKAKSEKLNSIKIKFNEAGVEKDETYFAENAERLLGLSEETLDFIIQEFVAFAQTNTKPATSSVKAPPLGGSDDKLNPRDLGRKLREIKSGITLK